MREYVKHRQSYIFELIRLEAPPQDRRCTLCNKPGGAYRCRDCYHPSFYCTSCCLSTHAEEPYHRIQRFNGEYFERYDLDKLGVLIDIRPHSGECVYNKAGVSGLHGTYNDNWDSDDDETFGQESDVFQSIPNVNTPHQSIGTRRMVIVSSTGICNRSVRFCTCTNASDKHIQLLRFRLYPATSHTPTTAFTFEVLDHFRLDALECNTAALGFMSKLTRMTNEVFPSTVPVDIYHHSIYLL